MTTQRPALWPLHDLLGTNLTTPENSLFMQSGYPVGLPVPSADHNGKFRRNGDWHKYLDLNGLRNADWLDSATFLAYRLTVDSLQYNSGGNVLAGGATVGKRGTYLINATRIETDATFLNPIGAGDGVQGDPLVFPTATAPGRIWVYAKDDGTVRFASVGVGVADAPGADEISLIGVDINALGVVTDGAVVPTTLALPAQQMGITTPLWVFGRGRMLRVSVTPDGNPAVLVEGGAGPGQRIDNDHATDPTLELNNSSANGLALTAAGGAVLANNSPTTPTLDVTNAGGIALFVTGSVTCNDACTFGSSAADVITVNGTTTFNAPVTVANGQAFVANGNVTLGNDIAVDTLSVIAASTFSGTVQFNGNVTVGNAITDTISFTAKAASTLDMDTNTLANVGRVQFTIGNTPSGAGQATADASGNLRYRPSATTHYVHTSEKGYIQAWSAAASGTEAPGAGTELAQVTINPLATGDVLVTATGSLTFAADTSVVLVTLYDTTSNTAICSQNERAPDIDGGANRTRSFVIRGIRTLPDTSARTFVVTLGAADSVDYANLITSAVGVR